MSPWILNFINEEEIQHYRKLLMYFHPTTWVIWRWIIHSSSISLTINRIYHELAARLSHHLFFSLSFQIMIYHRRIILSIFKQNDPFVSKASAVDRQRCFNTQNTTSQQFHGNVSLQVFIKNQRVRVRITRDTSREPVFVCTCTSSPWPSAFLPHITCIFSLSSTVKTKGRFCAGMQRLWVTYRSKWRWGGSADFDFWRGCLGQSPPVCLESSRSYKRISRGSFSSASLFHGG